MYNQYYNPRLKPFQISSKPRFLWFGEKHNEALAILCVSVPDPNLEKMFFQLHISGIQHEQGSDASQHGKIHPIQSNETAWGVK